MKVIGDFMSELHAAIFYGFLEDEGHASDLFAEIARRYVHEGGSITATVDRMFYEEQQRFGVSIAQIGNTGRNVIFTYNQIVSSEELLNYVQIHTDLLEMANQYKASISAFLGEICLKSQRYEPHWFLLVY